MAKKETKKENSKNKKSFFKDFKAELKKVNWPTPKQLANSTIAVVTVVIITAIIVSVLNLVFEGMNKYGIDKIKEIVVKDDEQNTDTTNTTDEENVDTTDTTDETENTKSEESTNTENNAVEGNTTENSEQ